jgi:cell shape-determining protein MreD
MGGKKLKIFTSGKLDKRRYNLRSFTFIFFVFKASSALLLQVIGINYLFIKTIDQWNTRCLYLIRKLLWEI